MIYYVFKLVRGERILHWSGEDREYAVQVESQLRRELRKIDPRGEIMDATLLSHDELQKAKATAERWDRLSDEEKNTFIEVDGRKYVKALFKEA